MAKTQKKAKKRPKNGVYHFPLRLRQDVADKVIERSEQQRRSLNAQIEHELDQRPH